MNPRWRQWTAFLCLGLAGAQPGLGERYISTGSLYLAAAADWSDPGMRHQALRPYRACREALPH